MKTLEHRWLKNVLLVGIATSFVAGRSLAMQTTTAQAQILKWVDARFPESFLGSLENAVVRLRAVIGADGHVEKLEVVRSSNPLVTQAAAEAIKQWVFYPSKVDGKPVSSFGEFDVVFAPPREPGRNGRACIRVAAGIKAEGTQFASGECLGPSFAIVFDTAQDIIGDGRILNLPNDEESLLKFLKETAEFRGLRVRNEK